ncbi:MAG: hypothetical protein A3J28_12635 [Acidobacteria bacterium RIFCSPLOWO2_12_FULL_60_22]|nr:MAG: hypothetical protein A3J28_12635 [Acidobacteria bacterium RIFCSPLOWO2_12_FULL_60_22]
MKRIIRLATLLALVTATMPFTLAQNTTTPRGEQQQTHKQDRVRTPGSEPSGTPRRDQGKDQMQKRDRIHTPGTGQMGSPGTGPRSGSRQPGSRRGGR